MSAVTLYNAAVGAALTACMGVHAICNAQPRSCAGALRHPEWTGGFYYERHV